MPRTRWRQVPSFNGALHSHGYLQVSTLRTAPIDNALRRVAPNIYSYRTAHGRHFRDSLKVHVLPEFGDLPLDAITRQEVLAMIQELRRREPTAIWPGRLSS